jgi:hypothetical protein
MNIGYEIHRILREIYTDEEIDGRSVPHVVMASIVIAAAIIECTEHVVEARASELAAMHGVNDEN